MSQIEARIAANSQSIRKICNDELAGPTSRHFNQQLLIHELISGSLVIQSDNPAPVLDRAIEYRALP